MKKYADYSNRMKGILGLESLPVAIAFGDEPPEGVEKMKGEIRVCQMLDKVRIKGDAFYTTVENHKCDGGSSSCGMKQMGERVRNGEFLSKMGLFETRRAARRFINSNLRIEYGTVKTVAFSPLEKATFEPDVVVLICNAKQGMLIAEAYAYDSGKRTTGMTGPPICSSIVAAPYLTGEVVYSFGDHGARTYMKIGDGEVYVGIPAELLSGIIDNLETMKTRLND